MALQYMGKDYPNRAVLIKRLANNALVRDDNDAVERGMMVRTEMNPMELLGREDVCGGT